MTSSALYDNPKIKCCNSVILHWICTSEAYMKCCVLRNIQHYLHNSPLNMLCHVGARHEGTQIK